MVPEQSRLFRTRLRPSAGCVVLRCNMTHDSAARPSTNPDQIRAAVRDRYAKASAGGDCSTVSPSCCGPSPDAASVARALGYADDATATVPEGSNLGLGCGNPTGLASLRAGETVLDLGSGAGFDAFLAARAVGPTGRVLGVDMTPEMLAKARGNLARSEARNVEFRLGEIEHLPVADASVDVVISNCVINLSPDKPQVFAEMFRVLKPGGRVAISDIVALRALPAEVRADVALYTGCIAGAAMVAELDRMLVAAGFTDVRIEPKAALQGVVDGWAPGHGLDGHVASATIEARKP